ncbi:MAG: hypothetical protein U0T79_09470 [Ferruginibacter sp.]
MGVKPSDFDILECYVEIGRRKFIAASLVTFGYRFFKAASIIQKLDDIIKFYDESNNHLNEFPKAFSNVLFDSLMDTIRISICFENYFKAKLLSNGFIIHNVDKNKNQILFKRQKNQPIDVKEITNDNSLNGVTILKNVLNETTLNYSVLLNEENYYKYFGIHKDLINFLSELNQKRNRLHLFTSEKTSLSRGILSNYKELTKIVDLDMAMLQSTLLNELDPESRSKLPIKL